MEPEPADKDAPESSPADKQQLRKSVATRTKEFLTERPKGFLAAIVEIGASLSATVMAMLLSLRFVGWIDRAAPACVIALAVWCGFAWGQYGLARQHGRWYAWLIFLSALVASSAFILGTLYFLIHDLGR
jgi:hypothetical protein